MKKWLIKESTHLHGTVAIQGAKNATQKIVPATVLWPGVYILRNIALTEDARALFSILRFLGADITFVNAHDVRINTENIISQEIPPELTALSTGTFLFAGALLGRFGEAKVWHPGGDRIGKRSVTWHLEAFRRLGATVTEHDAFYEVHASTLHGSAISFRKPTANGAINAIITAMSAKGTTRIETVAPEPEIQCALDFFQHMGGQIRWVGANTLEVVGTLQGTGSGDMKVIPDRNDAATFLIAGALGHGPITLHNARSEHLLPLLELLQRVGVTVEITTDGEKPSMTIQCDQLRAMNIQVTTRPFPGFSTDWGPMAEVLLTQVPGKHVFHETIFARRFAHIPELVQCMGAEIQSLDLPVDEQIYNFDREHIAPFAHAIAISGSSPLHGASVHANDVRAGAALVLAGLIAEGQTEVTGIEQIERGYESFHKRLRQLGASITVEETRVVL